jgi:hypothetical protein
MALPQVFPVTFGREQDDNVRTYHLLYNSWAIRELERVTGRSIQMLGVMIVSGRAGLTEQIQILWAGLEGHRWRFKPDDHPEPFTIDEVSMLVDDTCSMSEFKNEKTHPLCKAMADAFESAFPTKKREEEVPKGKKKKDPPKAVSSIGKTSSMPRH